jgi:hypothetical protein
MKNKKDLDIIEKIRNQIQIFQKTKKKSTLILKIQSSDANNNLSSFIEFLLDKLKISIIEINDEKCLCEWYFLKEVKFKLDLYFKAIENYFEIISIIHYEEEFDDIHIDIREYYDYYSDDEY